MADLCNISKNETKKMLPGDEQNEDCCTKSVCLEELNNYFSGIERDQDMNKYLLTYLSQMLIGPIHSAPIPKQ